MAPEWYSRAPWAVIAIPALYIAAFFTVLWEVVRESLWFARVALVIGVALLLVTGIALNAFDKPPRVLLGYEECFDVGATGRGERCAEATALADIDIGNPRWVHWLQQNADVTLAGGFILSALGIVGTGRNGNRRSQPGRGSPE